MMRLLFLLALLLASRPIFASEPPPLDKPAAQRILEAMAWSEVTLIAIRQGVDAAGGAAPIYATAVGLGKCQGQYRRITQTFYFDRDLDWHVLDLSEKSAVVWNVAGRREFKPWATW